MKNNPLLKYAEQLAVNIETLCKSLERKDNSNTIFQICKSSSSVFANITEAQYPKACLICYRNSKLPAKNVLKQKVG